VATAAGDDELFAGLRLEAAYVRRLSLSLSRHCWPRLALSSSIRVDAQPPAPFLRAGNHRRQGAPTLQEALCGPRPLNWQEQDLSICVLSPSYIPHGHSLPSLNAAKGTTSAAPSSGCIAPEPATAAAAAASKWEKSPRKRSRLALIRNICPARITDCTGIRCVTAARIRPFARALSGN
jgi:hypothetical protein